MPQLGYSRYFVSSATVRQCGSYPGGAPERTAPTLKSAQLSMECAPFSKDPPGIGRRLMFVNPLKLSGRWPGPCPTFPGSEYLST